MDKKAAKLGGLKMDDLKFDDIKVDDVKVDDLDKSLNELDMKPKKKRQLKKV